MTNSEQERRGSVDLLGELAKKRRREVQEESIRPQPAFLESIELSRSMYWFRPVVIPLGQVDPAVFLNYISHSYGSMLDPPDRGRLFGILSKEEILAASDEEILGKILTRTDRKNFSFSGGKFPLKMKTDFVPIRSIDINFECISVEVAGITQVATTIVEEVFQLLAAAAGSDKKADDAAQLRTLAAYGTATRISLPFAFERFVNDKINGFIHDQFLNGRNFAARTRTLSRKNNFEPTDVYAVITLDDFILQVNTQDKRTGANESSKVRFTVTAKDDYGTGSVLVSSTMKYDDHIKCLELLIESLEN